METKRKNKTLNMVKKKERERERGKRKGFVSVPDEVERRRRIVGHRQVDMTADKIHFATRLRCC